MSKMTDKDIIKALEFESTPMERNCVRATYKEDCLGFYCTKTGKLAENCMECKEHTMDWRGRHSKATLDLINRQQAEIKEFKKEKHRLQKALNQAEDYLDIAKAEIEKLKKAVEIHKGIAEDWKYEAKKLKEMVGEGK